MEYKREKDFRKVSKVFREVPDGPGKFRKVLEGSEKLRKFPEGPKGSGIPWKVPEGSHLGRTTPHRPCLGGQGSPRGQADFLLEKDSN